MGGGQVDKDKLREKLRMARKIEAPNFGVPGWPEGVLVRATLEVTQGQISSQPPTNATRFWCFFE